MTVTAATATTIVCRNGSGDVGRDDREHSGRAHQTNSRTHTHNMYTPLFARSFARFSRARARAYRHDVRRRRGKKKHRGSAIRADTRHCALARYRLAPVLHGRTRESLLERLVAKLRGRAPSLSRGSCRATKRARTTHLFAVHPYRSLPLSFANPRQSPIPTLYVFYSASRSPSASLSCLSIRLDYLSPSHDTRLPFSLFLQKTPPTPSIQNYYPLSLSLFSIILIPAGRDLQGGFFLLAEVAPPASSSRAPWQRDSLDGGSDNVNGVRSSTNVRDLPFL